MAEEPSDLIYGLAKRHYDNLVRVFQRYPSIEQILIFGSRAKNTSKPESDFDLAVFAPTMSASEFSQFWGEVTDLPIIFKLDVLHWDNIHNTKLKEKILNEGKIFYRKEMK